MNMKKILSPRKSLYLLMAMTIVLAGMLLSCDKAAPEASAGKDLVLSNEELAIVAKSNQFAFRFYREALKDLTSDKNALISPLSIQAALAMTWQGANGTTRDGMINAVGLQGLDQDLINGYFKKLIADLPALDPQTKLEIANSIWYRQEFQVIPAFLDVNRQFYKAEVNGMDFNAAGAADRINDWVNTKTRGKINQIVERLEADLMMLLINAVYFKGSWEQQFDESLTERGVFYPETDAAYVLHGDYMQVEHAFGYAQHPGFEMVELPYGNKKYSMLVLRPGNGESVGDLVDLLAETEGTALLGLEGLSARNMRLYLPKFKFSYKNKLNDELEALGMAEAFSDAADFTGINANGQLKISEVNHKSFIEVNEEGTEAAAVTSVGIVLTSVGPQAMTFKLDKPFLFAIREMSSGLILFVGQVNDPASEETKL